MSVRIQLDDPHTFYTNLDFISGKVILHLTSDENVSAILVKLEGESTTVLMRPMEPRGLGGRTQQPTYYDRMERRTPGGMATENHKILQSPAGVPQSGSAAGIWIVYAAAWTA